jgi:hypothetical protein
MDPDVPEHIVLSLRREVSEYDQSDKESICAPVQFMRSLVRAIGIKAYSGFTVWGMEGKVFAFDKEGWLSISEPKKRRASLPESMKRALDET